MHVLNDYELNAILHECDYIDFSALYCLIRFGGFPCPHSVNFGKMLDVQFDEKSVCLCFIDKLHLIALLTIEPSLSHFYFVRAWIMHD